MDPHIYLKIKTKTIFVYFVLIVGQNLPIGLDNLISWPLINSITRFCIYNNTRYYLGFADNDIIRNGCISLVAYIIVFKASCQNFVSHVNFVIQLFLTIPAGTPLSVIDAYKIYSRIHLHQTLIVIHSRSCT